MYLHNQCKLHILIDLYFNETEKRTNYRYNCQIFTNNKTVATEGSMLTSKSVYEYNGRHFNKETGKFVFTEDGTYLVSVTLHETEDKLIEIGMYVQEFNKGPSLRKSIAVECSNNSVGASLAVYIKKGDVLFFKVMKADDGAMLSAYSHISTVSL